MSFSPGEVLLQAHWSDGRITGVGSQSRRPSVLAGLRGQPVRTAATLLPLAYAVCTHAQRAACNAALSAATGSAVQSGCDSQAQAEAWRELALSVFTGAARPLAAAALKNLDSPAALRTLLESVALGASAGRWLELQSLGEFQSLLSGNDAPLAREASARLALWEPPTLPPAWLPAVDAGASLAGCPVLDAAFCAAPTWRGRPAETGSVARMQRHPLVGSLAGRPWLQRWLARLLELLGHAAGLATTGQATVEATVEATGEAGSLGAVSAVAMADGVGRSAVTTARGLLLHEVRLAAQGADGPRVDTYALCAPTEWNFHPDGPLPRWLEGAAAGSAGQARILLQRAAEALDPCVECRLVVSGGQDPAPGA